jgi:hypothetical protein
MTGSPKSTRVRWSNTSGSDTYYRWVQALQAQRDDRRASGSPSRTNHGVAVRTKERLPGTKKQREFTQADVNEVIVQAAQQNMQPGKPSRKPRQQAERTDAPCPSRRCPSTLRER